MITIDLFSFLKSNTSNFEIKIGDRVSKAVSLMGSPIEKVGKKDWGQLYFENGLRVEYTDNVINGIGIDFNHCPMSFPMRDIDGKYKGKFSGKTKIHRGLDILNESGIAFRYLNMRGVDYLYVITEGDVVLIFHIYDDSLAYILYSRLTYFNNILLDNLITA